MQNIVSKRFVVTTRSANAPKCKGGKYRRPVHVRVLDTTVSEWHAVRRMNDGMRYECRNVDSRYDGPRSAYGQALEYARALADKLNAEEATRVTRDIGSGI